MNSKKLFASIVALAMVVVALGANTASAATAEELSAQINQLQAQLAGLMGQLGEGTGSTASGVANANITACTGITFSRNLTLNSNGTDVKCLQALLNQDQATTVAVTGAGSAGNETMTFGGLTKAAVIAFQNKYQLFAAGLNVGTGYVGPITRAKLNAMLAGTVTPPITGPYPDGCTSYVGYSTTTGLPCSSTGTYPDGCTSTSGYSTTTGLKCDGTSTTPGITQTGAEGSITVSVNPTPAAGTSAYEGDSKVAVYGLKIKATGSDADVQRVTLQFDNQPYSYFTNVYLYDGDTEIASSALNSSTVSKVASSNYQITLSGFASKVIVAKDASKVLTVKVDVLPGISSGLGVTTTTSKLIKIGTPSTTAVRAVDQSGLNQYSGIAFDDGSATLGYRSFYVKASQTGSATLALSLNVNSTKSRNIIADTNNEITKATLMTFDLKATKDNLLVDTISDVQFTVNDTTHTGFIIPTTAYLVDDGGTVIGTMTPGSTSGKGNFTDLNYTVARDTTKTFSIKIDDSKTDYAGGKYEVGIATAKVAYEKSNGATGTSTGSATSNVAYAYNVGPEFRIASMTNAITTKVITGDVAKLSTTFNVEVKAISGDVYLAANSSTTSAFVVKTNNDVTVTDIYYPTPSNVVVGTGGDLGTFKVSDGNSATFAVKATQAGTGTMSLRMSSINWGTTATAALGGTGVVTSSYMDTDAAWRGAAETLQ